jgi:hypothetical protein
MADAVKKPFYRKVWFWVLVVIVVGIGAGGSSNSQPTKVGVSSVTQQSATTTSDQPTVFHVGDQVKLDNHVLVVNAVATCKSSNEFLKPATGNKYITVDITQENQGTEPVSYNLWDFKLRDDKEFSYSTALAGCKDPSFSSGTLVKGDKTRGFITFEIPASNTPSKVIFNPSWWSNGQITITL